MSGQLTLDQIIVALYRRFPIEKRKDILKLLGLPHSKGKPYETETE